MKQKFGNWSSLRISSLAVLVGCAVYMNSLSFAQETQGSGEGAASDIKNGFRNIVGGVAKGVRKGAQKVENKMDKKLKKSKKKKSTP